MECRPATLAPVLPVPGSQCVPAPQGTQPRLTSVKRPYTGQLRLAQPGVVRSAPPRLQSRAGAFRLHTPLRGLASLLNKHQMQVL